LCSPFVAERPAAVPIAIGAPQLDFAVAPPFAAVAPPCSRRRWPHPAAAARAHLHRWILI
jgi:hypothetical protein